MLMEEAAEAAATAEVEVATPAAAVISVEEAIFQVGFAAAMGGTAEGATDITAVTADIVAAMVGAAATAD